MHNIHYIIHNAGLHKRFCKFNDTLKLNGPIMDHYLMFKESLNI